LLRLGFFCGFVGILFSLLVSSSSVWVLLANLALIGAHLIGAAIAFWLLDRLHHYGYSQHQR
jgi:hypothetical protein